MHGISSVYICCSFLFIQIGYVFVGLEKYNDGPFSVRNTGKLGGVFSSEYGPKCIHCKQSRESVDPIGYGSWNIRQGIIRIWNGP
jgi:hypothetical protein